MKVMIALDGSRLAETSLAYLPALEAVGIESVVLVAVVEEFDEGAEIRGSEEFFERQSVLYSAYLADAAKKLTQAVGYEVRTELWAGVPDQEIQKVATAREIDLLMLTTHGRSGISRWTIGSVADKIIRRADRPTFVVGPQAVARGASAAIKRILAPVDGSGLGERGLVYAGNWAKALSAELHVVRVVNLPVMTPEDSLVAYNADVMQSLRDAAEHYLRQLPATTGVKPASTAVLTGSTASELIGYCEEQGIDLVVMSSHGRRGMMRAVLGSTTDRMLHAPAPVLIVPSC